ncbi:MAG: SIMPL domain-containing protein [Pseudomonadota bacterium]
MKTPNSMPICLALASLLLSSPSPVNALENAQDQQTQTSAGSRTKSQTDTPSGKRRKSSDKALNRYVSVSGQGTVSASPDQAVLRFSVEARTATALDAMNEASAKADAVLKFLASSGIEQKAITTTRLSLSPQFSYEDRRDPKLIGYTAANGLSVKVTDLEALGTIVDGVIRSGANRFDGISFTIEDRKKLLDDARKDAVDDARRKAELYAKAAGASLGEVVSISEPGARPPSMPGPVMAMEADFAPRAAPIEPGEMTLSARVTITYALK